MRYILTIVWACWAAFVTAQPPKPQPPALPAINPAQARLDQTLGGLDGPCYALVATPAAEFLIAGGEKGTLISWPRSTWLGVRVGSMAPDVSPAHEGPITALAWANGAPLVSAGADRKIRFWSMPAREPAKTLETGQVVRALALSDDGKRLAAGDDSNTIYLYDIATGNPAGKLTGHTDWILCLAFSPDGSRLVSGSHDGHAILWDVPGAKKLLELTLTTTPPPAPAPALPAATTAVAFRPDGKMIAVGTSGGQVLLCNPADGKLLRATAAPHASTVTGLAFHPGGALLASCSRDRTVKLWNPDNGQLAINLEGHTAWVEGIAFLEKGTRLASVSADQTVRIWDLTPKK